MTKKSTSSSHQANKDDSPILTILVVDNEPQIRDILKRVFQMLGHTVVLASSAQEAIAQTSALAPHLIFADYHLERGKMDGLELVAELKKLQPNTFVVLISGDYIEEIEPADSFLQKPISFGDLREVIEHYIANNFK